VTLYPRSWYICFFEVGVSGFEAVSGGEGCWAEDGDDTDSGLLPSARYPSPKRISGTLSSRRHCDGCAAPSLALESAAVGEFLALGSVQWYIEMGLPP